VNLANEKSQPNPRDLDILQDLHDRAKQLYAELLAATPAAGKKPVVLSRRAKSWVLSRRDAR
jgi:hypothetical protein